MKPLSFEPRFQRLAIRVDGDVSEIALMAMANCCVEHSEITYISDEKLSIESHQQQCSDVSEIAYDGTLKLNNN